uniref:Putative spindle pole body component alp6 protein n=1 Tax=Chaetomium thermophilum (strain DSM 1495 / CBS 144.50 / IMI 039719) TaxID=759272 RepID=UPI0015C697B9|nr:Chain A, Putative spindle pole body component alp6 protein [Thermochaetoides thermophila DSM 1495]
GPLGSMQRINNAIDSLIGHLVPAAAGDDDDARTRRQAVFDLVRALLEQPGSNIPSDVNHASDLIKRRLISTNPSQALRFSNLYTRLLALPVLNQKWAILYLLHQLAD